MKAFLELLIKIFTWLWIGSLLTLAIYYFFFFKDNFLYTKLVGSVLLIALAVRRILLFFNFISKGNPYIYFIVFLIASTLPPISEFSFNHDKGQTLSIYVVIIASLIYYLGKKGKFGKSMKDNIKKSENKVKEKEDNNRIEIDRKTKAREELNAIQKKELESKKLEVNLKKEQEKEKIHYCMYCGSSTNGGSVHSLLINRCGRGRNKGNNHVLYEGTIKKEYTCKFCGVKYPTISTMTLNKCKSSNNNNFHVPAL